MRWCFPIRCYLCAFQDIDDHAKWGRRLHRVIRDLPEELATYKGFIDNRPMMLDYLSKFDDGLPTSPGIWPEKDVRAALATNVCLSVTQAIHSPIADS